MSARILSVLCGATLFVCANGVRAAETEQVTVYGLATPPLDQPMAHFGADTEALREHGITSLFDLGQAVPGLRVDRYGINTQPNLRGIGVQNVQGPGVNPEVAIYVDGYYQAGLGTAIDLANVARVDVLKGPQGTQFGRNATGGAILITTADPDFEMHGKASLSYGSFNDRQLQAYFTTALSTNLAMDISIFGRKSDNYFEDIVTGGPSAPIASLSARAKLLYQISKGGRLILAAGFSDVADPTGVAYIVQNSIASLYHDAYGVPQVHTETPYKTSTNRRLIAGPKDRSLSLTGEFDLGWADFTSRTLFRKERNHMYSDQDGTSIGFLNADFGIRNQTLSQELGLAGRNDRLQWQAGLYYANDLSGLHHNSSQDLFGSGVNTSLFHSDLRVATDSVALFADATYSLAEDWFLTAGARGTHERKSMRSSDLLQALPTPATDSKDWDSFTPRLALRHALSPDANIYASVAQGFRSGNYNFLGVGPQAPVKAQRNTQYEVGYKQAGDDWSLDAAFYLTNIRDLQISTLDGSCGCFHFQNAPRAQSYGAELSVSHVLGENLSLSGSVAWIHARYLQFTGEGSIGQAFVPPDYGYATGATDFAGAPMIYSPDWTGNIGLDWHLPTATGLWNAVANLSLTSRVPFAPYPQASQSGYGLLNISAGWTAPGTLWSITASGQNVTGQIYQTFSSLSFLGKTIAYGPPASWTLRVTRNF